MSKTHREMVAEFANNYIPTEGVTNHPMYELACESMRMARELGRLTALHTMGDKGNEGHPALHLTRRTVGIGDRYVTEEMEAKQFTRPSADGKSEETVPAPCLVCKGTDPKTACHTGPDEWSVECRTCGVRGPIVNGSGKTKESVNDANRAWNRMCGVESVIEAFAGEAVGHHIDSGPEDLGELVDRVEVDVDGAVEIRGRTGLCELVENYEFPFTVMIYKRHGKTGVTVNPVDRQGNTIGTETAEDINKRNGVPTGPPYSDTCDIERVREAEDINQRIRDLLK